LINDILKPLKKKLWHCGGIDIQLVLVGDALMEGGYKVHLANPAAIQQYSGLKHTDDKHDAFCWQRCCG